MSENIGNAPPHQGLLFNCERCGQPIEVAAALLFSSPEKDMVSKHHLCAECYRAILKEFTVHNTLGPP